MPQKEPSPLLDRKIEILEAKFAGMTDEELEDLGEDDGELGDQSHPRMQSSMSSDMDIMSYTPPQVRVEKYSLTNVNILCEANAYLCLLAVHTKIHEGPFKEGGLEAEDQHERLHPVQQ